MAEAVYLRYCATYPYKYSQIGQRLGITPEHARRLVERGLLHLAKDRPFGYLDTTIEQGSRLWIALERARSRRHSRRHDSS